MIEEITLQNFQSHKDSTLKFHPGVNTIIGTSDHGKSSIVRAFSLVHENQPDGDAYVSNSVRDKKGKAKENAVVEVTVDNGSATRIRGVDNEYTAVIKGQLQEYHAVGRGNVPEEVSGLLNMSELNVQKQKDSFFLFNSSPGEILRKINTYTDLELIDKMLAKADSAVRENRSQLKIATAEHDKYTTQLEVYTILDTLDELLKTANETEEGIGSKEADGQYLQDLICTYDEINQRIEGLSHVERVERKLTRTIEKQTRIENLSTEIEGIQFLVEQFQDLTRLIPVIPEGIENQIQEVESTQAKVSNKEGLREGLQEIISAWDSVETQLQNLPVDIDLSGAVALMERIREKETVIQEVKAALERVEEIEQEGTRLLGFLEDKEQQYHDMIGDVCPLCGSEIGGRCEHK